MAAILNDIRAALGWLRESSGAGRLSLLRASFTGGACACYAARRAAETDRLVPFNPQLDCKKRTIDSRAYWRDDQLGEDETGQLSELGGLQFMPTLRHGRAIHNEVFWFAPLAVPGEITASALLVHGTEGTFGPAEESRAAAGLFTARLQQPRRAIRPSAIGRQPGADAPPRHPARRSTGQMTRCASPYSRAGAHPAVR